MERVRLDLLLGAGDPGNPLSKLGTNPLIWGIIFKHVHDEWYERHIDRTASNPFLELHIAGWWFPPSKGININMMPIKLFDPMTVPRECLAYYPLISRCASYCRWRGLDHVAYLTIQEGEVPAGQSQRRPGLHVERPGLVIHGGKAIDPTKMIRDPMLARRLLWGSGHWDSDTDLPLDGIFMASNVSNSCKVWPCLINQPEEVTDEHGGIEHMRHLLGEGEALKAGKLCWFTDCTPHESLPITKPGVHRQFFRLVVGGISVWHSEHNTPNPRGVLPDAPISDVNKFAPIAQPIQAESKGGAKCWWKDWLQRLKDWCS